MSFTFVNNGTHPIAIVTSPEGKEYIYLSDNPPDDVPRPATTPILNMKLSPNQIATVMSSLGRMSINEVVAELTEDKSEFPGVSSYFRTYRIDEDEEIETVPAEDTERVYIAGESGCGKSTIAAKFCREWLKVHPDGKIFFFLRQDDDAFDDIPGNVMILDFDYDDEQNKQDIEDLIRGDINIDQLENSLCVLDDCDNLQDKKMSIAIHKLINDVTTNGRKRGISVIYISHLLMNYAQTRVMLNEANKVFFFPGCGTTQIERFLKTYASMRKQEAEELASMNSRWVMLSRARPRFVIYEKGIFFL